MDILQATLASGIRVVKFVPSYGDQPNDITHVTKCTFVARFFGGRCGAVMLTDCMRSRMQTSGTSSVDTTYVLLSICAGVDGRARDRERSY